MRRTRSPSSETQTLAGWRGFGREAALFVRGGSDLGTEPRSPCEGRSAGQKLQSQRRKLGAGEQWGL